ncbi:MAG: YceI family protein, partial [Chitinophagaceae bacterium]|nr:YceI family protein [Chitinophagaceae bacterium]
MKKFPALILFVLITNILSAQLYMTKKATVSFHSHTWLEDVDAVNNGASAVIDIAKKDIAFSMQVKEFSFKKKLMQEHFNENYIESDKYPKSTFNGSYTGDVDITKNGSYPITVKGKITLHGVTKDIEVPATLTVNSGVLTGTSTFKLNPKDFNISIPMIVRDKIEKENTVNIKADWTINN